MPTRRSSARVNKDWHVSQQAEWLDRARAVAAFYGLHRKVDDKAVERLQARISRERIRQEKIRREQEAEREKRNQETIAAWLKGAGVYMPYLDKCYLRKVGNEMETSKGVKVPWKDAVRAFKFALEHGGMAHQWASLPDWELSA